MSGPPRARSEGIITEKVGDELMVYDGRTQRAHCLSADAMLVWERCDGRDSVKDIARHVGLEQARVAEAVAQLSMAGLLEEPPRISRRALYKRAAKLGAAAVSAPLIYSIAVPAPSVAQSNPCSQVSGSACVVQWSNSTCSGPQLNDSCQLQSGSAVCTCQIFPDGQGGCATLIPGQLWGRAGTCA
jgi:hypothetical protein